MNKLKTLKDLKKDTCKIAPADESTIYGFSEILKQEVIRWIKLGNMVEGAKFWARVFFNITEEDLKNGP